MNSPVELHYAMHGTIEELPAFFEAFEAWGESNNVPSALAASFGLMLDELLTNVAVHGYAGKGGPVKVRVNFAELPPTLQAVVRDDASPFDPTTLASPDVNVSLADRKIGGLGIHFVRKLADQMTYRRDGDANEVTVSKTWTVRKASS